MTDDGKRNDFADLTVPVPVRADMNGSAKSVPTDEADAETFIGEKLMPPPGAVSDMPVDATENRPARKAAAEGSAVRVRIPASFDAEVAQQKIAARPARIPTPQPAAKSRPQPVDVTGEGPAAPADVFSTPGDTSQFMQAVFAGADSGVAGKASRPDRVSTKKLAAEVPVSDSDRADPDEPTRAKDPEPYPSLGPSEVTQAGTSPATQAAAPVMNAEDAAESIPTAPIPMITGLNQTALRDDEPSLPTKRPDPAPVPMSAEGFSAPAEIGDGIERDAPPVAAVADAPVDHTPLYVNPHKITPNVHTDVVDREQLAREDTKIRDVTAPDIEIPPKKSPVLLIAVLGTVAALLLVAAVVVVVLYRGAPEEPTVAAKPPPSTTNQPAPVDTAKPTKPAPVDTAAPTKPAPVDTAAPTNAAPVDTAAPKNAAPVDTAAPKNAAPVDTAAPKNTAPVDATPAPLVVVDATKPAKPAPVDVAAPSKPATVDVAAPSKPAPVDVAATPAKPVDATPPKPAAVDAPVAPPKPPPPRRADGFGPFVDRSGSSASGLSAALESVVRAAAGDLSGDALVGVRGEIRRIDTRRDKEKKLTVSADCTLTVFDKTGGHATLGATAKAVGDDKDALSRQAVETCARSLEPELKAAVARARG